MHQVNSGTTLLGEILELNLTYLLLAQRELKRDFQAACNAFNFSTELAQVLANLTAQQIKKLATTNGLLLRFNWNDALILERLANKAPTILTAPVPEQRPAAENAEQAA
nr:flagellar transcriptional regulator FlhD [Burkholderia multivorans]